MTDFFKQLQAKAEAKKGIQNAPQTINPETKETPPETDASGTQQNNVPENSGTKPIEQNQTPQTQGGDSASNPNESENLTVEQLGQIDSSEIKPPEPEVIENEEERRKQELHMFTQGLQSLNYRIEENMTGDEVRNSLKYVGKMVENAPHLADVIYKNPDQLAIIVKAGRKIHSQRATKASQRRVKTEKSAARRSALFGGT